MTTSAKRSRLNLRPLSAFYLGLVVGTIGAVLLGRSIGQPRRDRPDAGIVAAEAQLERIIPSINLQELPLDEAIGNLRKLTGANITVDYQALGAVGINARALVTLHGSNISLHQVLEQLCTTLNAGFEPVNGTIRIASFDALPARPLVRTYDVRDIIAAGITLPDPDEGPTIGPSTGPLSTPVPQGPIDAERERAKAFIGFVEESVQSPAQWASHARIYYLNGRLIVLQNWEGHRAIRQLLQQLREPAPPLPRVATDQEWDSLRESWILPAPTDRLDAAMRAPMGPIHISAQPFSDAIDALRELSGVPIFFDQEALKAADFDPNTKVNLWLKDATLASALSLLLHDPVGKVQLWFTEDAAAVTISTKSQLDRSLMRRIYDVRDLIPPLPYSPNPAGPDPRTRAQIISDLKDLIQKTIDPASWTGPLDRRATIEQMYGRLVIVQSWSNHQKIEQLLQTLRRSGMTAASAKSPR